MSRDLRPVSIRELCEATGKGKPSVYALIESRELPGYKTSKGYIIPRPWFEAWLEGRWTPNSRPPIHAVPDSLVKKVS